MTLPATACHGCGSRCHGDPSATVDDGSCDFACTAARIQMLATTIHQQRWTTVPATSRATAARIQMHNYDATATVDDASCDFACTATDQMLATTIHQQQWTTVPATARCGCGSRCCTIHQRRWTTVPATSRATAARIAACNYEPSATVDDASCDFTCYGCTDQMLATRSISNSGRRFLRLRVLRLHGSDACNYDPSATVDDSSCDFACCGCTDPDARRSSATVDDGSCDFACYGCTDRSLQLTPATVEDNSCDFTCCGCTDGANYDATATVDDASCDFVLWLRTPRLATTTPRRRWTTVPATSRAGCTDPAACLRPQRRWRTTPRLHATAARIQMYSFDATATVDACDFVLWLPGPLGLQTPPRRRWTTVPATSLLRLHGPRSLQLRPAATLEDNSCDFACYGCTDPELATTTPRLRWTTLPTSRGCTDPRLATTTPRRRWTTVPDFACYGCGPRSLQLRLQRRWRTTPATSRATAADPDACNYDATATVDDASCDFACYGCTDPRLATTTPRRRWTTVPATSRATAARTRSLQLRPSDGGGQLRLHVLRLHGSRCLQRDATATVDDASCDFVLWLHGPSACNYDATATVDDGSCDFACYGCTDPAACNYDPATLEDNSCDFTCYGCTDPDACNYDATATVDDASCDFTCYGCTDPSACNYDHGDGGRRFINTACYGCTDPQPATTTPRRRWTTVPATARATAARTFPACNYDATATVDDASCDFTCYGCTDPSACNYDATATVDDGSCDYACYSCTDPAACNYDPTATLEDNSCDFTCYGCTDPQPATTTPRRRWTTVPATSRATAARTPLPATTTPQRRWRTTPATSRATAARTRPATTTPRRRWTTVPATSRAMAARTPRQLRRHGDGGRQFRLRVLRLHGPRSLQLRPTATLEDNSCTSRATAVRTPRLATTIL